MSICPHCNGTGISGFIPGVDALRQLCIELGILVGPDDSVSERDAAALLNRSPYTLRNWRHSDRRLAYVRSGVRARYLLMVLADYLKNSD